MAIMKLNYDTVYKTFSFITAFSFSIILLESHAAEYILSWFSFLSSHIIASPVTIIFVNIALIALLTYVLYHVYYSEFSAHRKPDIIPTETAETDTELDAGIETTNSHTNQNRLTPYDKRILRLLYFLPLIIASITAIANFSEIANAFSSILATLPFIKSAGILYYFAYAISFIAGVGLFSYMMLRGFTVIDAIFNYFQKSHTIREFLALPRAFFRVLNVTVLLTYTWYVFTGTLPTFLLQSFSIYFGVHSASAILSVLMGTLILSTSVELIYNLYEYKKAIPEGASNKVLLFKNSFSALILSIVETFAQCLFQFFFMTHLIAEAGVECKGSSIANELNPLSHLSFFNARSVFFIAFLSEFFIDGEILTDQDDAKANHLSQFSIAKAVLCLLHIPLFIYSPIPPVYSFLSMVSILALQVKDSWTSAIPKTLLYMLVNLQVILLVPIHPIAGPIAGLFLLLLLNHNTFRVLYKMLKAKKHNQIHIGLLTAAACAALVCGYMSTYELSVVFPLHWNIFAVLMISGLLVETAVWYSSIIKNSQPKVHTIYEPKQSKTLSDNHTQNHSSKSDICTSVTGEKWKSEKDDHSCEHNHYNFFSTLLKSLVMNPASSQSCSMGK